SFDRHITPFGLNFHFGQQQARPTWLGKACAVNLYSVCRTCSHCEKSANEFTAVTRSARVRFSSSPRVHLVFAGLHVTARLLLGPFRPASSPGVRSSSVELTLLRRAGQGRRRRRRVHGGGDAVEVAGADLTLVLGRGVTPLLGREFALLQLHIGAHLV